jgi:hypothetical protein
MRVGDITNDIDLEREFREMPVAPNRRFPGRDPHILHIEGDESEPVTPEHPLVGLETLVLKAWLASPTLWRQYRHSAANRSDIENAVRLKVDATFVLVWKLRAQGLTPELAAELVSRDVMWTPPTWPLTPTSHQPSKQEKETA